MVFYHWYGIMDSFWKKKTYFAPPISGFNGRVYPHNLLKVIKKRINRYTLIIFE